MKIGVIVGSLRKESYSRKIAEALVELFPEDWQEDLINIDLPMYNQDLDDEGSPPQAWLDFRAEIQSCDAYLFVSPEYNRSMPAIIKNAIDVGSRPYGQSSWSGCKRGAIVTVSPSKIGGFGANHALRQAFVFLDIALLQQPEMYIGEVAGLLDKNGAVVPQTKEFLQFFMDKFVKWVN